MTTPWYRTRWPFVLIAALVLALFDIYFWFSQVPKPENIAPGGWNSESSQIDVAYVSWYLLVAAVPVLLALAFLGPLLSRPASWPRRAVVVLLLVAVEVTGFSILLLVGPYP